MKTLKIVLHPKKLKESQQHVVLNVRLKKKTVARIDELAGLANCTRCKMISSILNTAVEYTHIE